MKLTEVLNSVKQYEWDGDPADSADAGQATFQVNGKEYMVLFTFFEGDENNQEDSLPDRYDIEFGLYPDKDDHTNLMNYGISGTGNQFEVFSTVVAICIEWFRYHPTNCITMSAKEPSRKKLYNRLLRQLVPDWRVVQRGDVIIAFT